MNLKLDENIDLRVVTLLRLAGHDVATVPGQGLISASDRELINICRAEARCLVTCDRGFGNRLKYNPANYARIVIMFTISLYFCRLARSYRNINSWIRTSRSCWKVVNYSRWSNSRIPTY